MTKIGIAQLQFGDDDLDCAKRRWAKSVAAIDRLAAAGAEVVVLPELAACGYVLDAGHLRDHAEPAQPTGAALGAWVAAARRHRISIVGGFAERDGDALYNAAIALGPDGEVIGHYRKLHLFGAEHAFFTPGDLGLLVFQLGALRAGLLICYDLRFPEAPRLLALQGAEVVLVPTAWVAGFDRPGPRVRRFIGQIEAALVHANLNQTYIVCADFAGRQRSLDLLGQSLAVDPYGTILAGPLPGSEPAETIVEVDAEVVRSALERGPGISPRGNRRVDVYDDHLGYDPSNGASDERSK